MSITERYYNFEKYGQLRYFEGDRCINDKRLRAFNNGKINAAELVTFDIALMEANEIDKEEIAASQKEQILAIMVRPGYEPVNLERFGFTFCGYDLIEEDTGISAITNCGAGFEQAINYDDLNEYGLLPSFRDATLTQIALMDFYADEPHAYCDVVEIHRKIL